MIVETIIGIPFLILLIVVLPVFVSNDIFFWFSFVFLFVVSVFGIKLYTKCFLALRNVHESSLAESLKKKITILSRYVNQLNLYNYILTPVVFFLGVCLGYSKGRQGKEINLEFHKGAVFFLLVIVMLLIWLTKKYIYALYGKYLKIIEEIYEDLVSEE